MKQIYIVRHGQSHSNAGGHAMLNAEIPLTELGHQQSQEVADWLIQNTNAIQSISVSKYLRTHLTAQPLVKITGLEPNVIDGLHEFNHLAFSSIEHTSVAERLEIASRYWLERSPDYIDGGDAYQPDEKANHPESFNHFVNRTNKVLTDFQRLSDGTHVVYSHGLWISMLIWQILNQPTNDNQAMQKFRQFEQSIRAKNCEVFLLTLTAEQPPAITKVRHRTDNNTNVV